MKKLYLFTFTLVAALCREAAADISVSDKQPDLQTEKLRQTEWLKRLDKMPSENEQALPQAEIKEITDEDLVKDAILARMILMQALNIGETPLIRNLAEIYRKHPNIDTALLARADALLAVKNGDFQTALNTFETLKKQQPNDMRTSLDYAALLFADKQWNESSRLFAETEMRGDLPETVLSNIQRYRQVIQQKNGWQFGGNVNLSYDGNLNNAAPHYCTPLGCTNELAESGTGLNYQFSAEKNTPLGGHHNLVFQSRLNGTSYYFDKKSQYDQALGRAYAGWAYEDGLSRFSILPFYQLQLAGTDEFPKKSANKQTFKLNMLTHAYGFQTAYSRNLSPELQAYVSAEHYRQHYRPENKAETRDGSHASIFGSLAYQISPHHLVFAGIGDSVFSPDRKRIGGKTNNAAYSHPSISGGWFAAWPKLSSLETRFRAVYSSRRYKGSALDTAFQAKRRTDREWFYSASLSHPKIRYKNIQPRLTWEHSQTRSSHEWANRKQNRVFVEIEKRF